MIEGKFNVILDQAWGSSGKGKTSTWLADRFSVTAVSSSNFPNAGHSSVFEDGTKFVAKAIPTAVILKKVKGLGIDGFVSPGSGFDPLQMMKEWSECGFPKLWVHPRASVVTEAHRERERAGSGSTKHIASTMQGSAAAMVDKVLRKADVALAGNMAGSADDPQGLKHLLEFAHAAIPGFSDAHEARFGKQPKVEDVLELLRIPTALEFRTLTRNMIQAGQTWLHEGSQGYALSIDHGSHYPACLARDSRVLMADGSTKKIRNIKIGDLVLSRDEHGRIVRKPVLNSWKKDTGTKKWFNIVTETSVYNDTDQQWVGPKLTGDHKVQTLRGKIRTEELVPGDHVFVNESDLVGDGLQIFLGSMLGDGSVPAHKRNSRRAKLEITHGESQSGYASAKGHIFRSYIGGSERTIITGSGSFKEGCRHTRYVSSASLSVARLATRLGCLGRKKPDMESIVDMIDVRGLAIWFQDDGRFKQATNGPEVIFYTNGFTVEECERLASALNQKFGWLFTLNMSKGTAKDGVEGKKYPTLRLSRKDHDSWFKAISSFVHPELQYKLPDAFKAAWSWKDPGEIKCTTEVVLKVVPARKFRSQGICHDIEIEDTHNFFVSNDKGAFNVENCTSRNCTLQAAMDHMAVPPSMVGDVYLNLRSYPIRVGNLTENGMQVGYSGDFYPDCEELTWEEVARRSGMPPEEAAALAERERTTVTKRIRRVATFSMDGLRDAAAVNGATKLVVNFAQYLCWKDAGLRGGREAFLKLSSETRKFIDDVQEASGVPVVLVGTGASHEDMISLL